MRDPRRIGGSFLILIVLLACTGSAMAQFRFAVTPIGENLHRGRALAINGSGEVAGLYGEEEVTQTFRWTPAGGLELLAIPAPATWARASDVNDAGSVLVFDSAQRVWLWENSGLHEVSDLFGSGPTALNTQVQIVGTRSDIASYRAFRWHNGVEQPLPAPDGAQVYAGGINQAGDIVGAIDYTPTLWLNDGTVLTLSQNGYAYDVNSARWVVGADRGEHAFLWTPSGGWQDMGVHPAADFHRASDAVAINDIGHAVGHAEINTAEDRRAFFWTADEGMMDLNALLDASGEGWVLEVALDINNSDQIVGYGLFNGQQQAFLLTPVQVPEPATLVVMLVMLPAMLSGRRRMIAPAR